MSSILSLESAVGQMMSDRIRRFAEADLWNHARSRGYLTGLIRAKRKGFEPSFFDPQKCCDEAGFDWGILIQLTNGPPASHNARSNTAL